ncbi:unnamed protein product [Mycetohabitans rhizoxinica HKI 454]|uniref:Uncharacterized protein n=1 Tax=Mycetohabitans rhizoxinica (strain DSM 19002 / CIP 109453 / HKI 454) TaxID=882378 RepID=E5AR63_MYCRK|nr:unnamed protein product [Mycetohabitans rhizoxinica HKI 454]
MASAFISYGLLFIAGPYLQRVLPCFACPPVRRARLTLLPMTAMVAARSRRCGGTSG